MGILLFLLVSVHKNVNVNLKDLCYKSDFYGNFIQAGNAAKIKLLHIMEENVQLVCREEAGGQKSCP